MQFKPSHRTVVFAKEFIMIRFGSVERDYPLSKGDMTLEKDLRSQHGKDVQLHNLLGSSRQVNKLRTISASMYKVIAISCKKTSKFFLQTTSPSVPRQLCFILESKWFKLKTFDRMRRTHSTKQLE